MVSAQVTIRSAEKSDAAVLARLIDMAGEGIPRFLWSDNPEHLDPMEWGAKRVAREEGGFSYRNAHVATVDGEIAGMVLGCKQPDPYDTGDLDELPEVVRALVELEALAPGSWYVNALAVMPGRRGTGVGSTLLAFAETLAAETGAEGMSLIVSEQNTGAYRLYRQSGYQPAGRRPMIDYPGAPDGGEWVLMVKPDLSGAD